MIGASAGGVEALRAVVSGLSSDLPAAVLVVLHIPRYSESALAKILARGCPLPVGNASDGEPVRQGRVYVAPPDHHLLALDNRIRLSREPSENGHRPAIDPLFRSVASAYGPRALEEQSALSDVMAAKSAERGDQGNELRFRHRARESGKAADMIRDLIERLGGRHAKARF